MRLLAVVALLCFGCGDNTRPSEPDASIVDATHCAALNQPPECWDDPCPDGYERVTYNEEFCKHWSDDICVCFQCRVIYESWCEAVDV